MKSATACRGARAQGRKDAKTVLISQSVFSYGVELGARGGKRLEQA